MQNYSFEGLGYVGDILCGDFSLDFFLSPNLDDSSSRDVARKFKIRFDLRKIARLELEDFLTYNQDDPLFEKMWGLIRRNPTCFIAGHGFYDEFGQWSTQADNPRGLRDVPIVDLVADAHFTGTGLFF